MEHHEDSTPNTPVFRQNSFEKADFVKTSLLLLSPNCKYGAHRNKDADIVVSDLEKDKTVITTKTASWPQHIVFLDNQTVAYIAKEDNSVWRHDIFDVQVKCPLDPNLKPIKLTSTSSDLLLILSLDHAKKSIGVVHCWNTNLTSGLELHEIANTEIVDQIPAFFNKNKLITYTNNDKKYHINIFSLAQMKTPLQDTIQLFQSKTLKDHRGPINDLALDAKNDILASASHDNYVLVWDLEKNHPETLVQELLHPNKVLSVAFHPTESKFILSGTTQEKSFGTIHLWNYLLQEQIARFAPNEGGSLALRSLRWPVPTEILVGSTPGKWHKFVLDVEQLLEKWRADKNRN
jgi:WD40 repeat protein